MRLQNAKSPKRGPGKAAKRKAALSAQQTIPYLVMPFWMTDTRKEWKKVWKKAELKA